MHTGLSLTLRINQELSQQEVILALELSLSSTSRLYHQLDAFFQQPETLGSYKRQ